MFITYIHNRSADSRDLLLLLLLLLLCLQVKSFPFVLAKSSGQRQEG